MSALKFTPMAVLVAVMLAGCGEGPYGERPQVVFYEQGEYQGKPDDLPWDNQRFNNDRTAWTNEIKTRQQRQNEYQRIQ